MTVIEDQGNRIAKLEQGQRLLAEALLNTTKVGILHTKRIDWLKTGVTMAVIGSLVSMIGVAVAIFVRHQ